MRKWKYSKEKQSWAYKAVEWQEEDESDTVFISVVFSWDLHAAYQRAVWLKQEGYNVRAGGPAVMLNPDYLSGVADMSGEVNALPHHNPNATFTSRGCIRQCKFCAVPIIEGHIKELTDWEPKPIVCDNNLLACSVKHFDDVIDKLKLLNEPIDFNQGLDARLLTQHHADRLSELDCMVRFAWDLTATEDKVMAAIDLVHKAGIPKKMIRVYVLIGFHDTPEDALYRLQTLKDMGVWPNPMRYQPLNALKRNIHVDENWTHKELSRYMAYWASLRWNEHIPFSEYKPSGYKPPNEVSKDQMALL